VESVFDIHIVFIGAIVGVLIGLTGMGGGSLMTPMMIFLLRVSPLTAVGTDLVFAAVTKIFGAAVHYRLGNVDLKLSYRLLTGSIPGALFGILLLKFIQLTGIVSVETFLKEALGIVLILVAVSLFYRPLWENLNKKTAASVVAKRARITVIYSFAIGVLVSITSIGSGTLFMPFLLFFYTMHPSKLVGTDVLHGAVLVSGAALFHLFSGNVNAALLLNLLLGSVPGVILSSRLSVLFPKRILELILASVLFISGYKLI
jgi:uncharacterized membrane protein YfcA